MLRVRLHLHSYFHSKLFPLSKLTILGRPRRWHSLVSSWPNCIGADAAVQSCQGLTEQYEVLGDYLKGKTCTTLEKRATSVSNYCIYLDRNGLLFPGNEQALYEYLCAERTAGRAPSRMKGTMEALTFVQFVLQVDVADLISFRRCHDVGSLESTGPKAQASPLHLWWNSGRCTRF